MNMEGQVRIISVTAFVAMSVACGGSGLPTTQPSSVNAVDAGRSLVAAQKQSATGTSSGRFKASPDGTCIFDPNDSGPDQCTPAVVVPGNPPSGGRFKAQPDGSCVFVPNDGGPNQCTPAGFTTTPPSSGRFKLVDGTCVFASGDLGPNQCTPAVVIPGNPPSGGRFKAGPDGSCVFVPNDAGPNQCTP
jgi:hypothetical protein